MINGKDSETVNKKRKIVMVKKKLQDSVVRTMSDTAYTDNQKQFNEKTLIPSITDDDCGNLFNT